jgi:hypothetical protein
MIKKFQNVEAEDFLYIIDPADQSIKATKVTLSKPHPKSANQAVWYIEFYKILRIDVKPEVIERAAEVGDMIDKVLVNKNDSMAFLMSKIPTMLCTSREELEKWMAEAKK